MTEWWTALSGDEEELLLSATMLGLLLGVDKNRSPGWWKANTLNDKM
jgi:hypothetical protein